MGYTFDIELDTDQPFVVELTPEYQSQVLNGAIVLQLTHAEKFKLANVSLHGFVGVALNADTKPTIVHERLLESTIDLIAANDTEGHGTIAISESGTQYIPFRLDLPHPSTLPPTLVNKLDTHFIDWKYEIHASLQRNSIFSSTRTIKRDLILRRSITSKDETAALITVSTDMPKQFKSKLTVPSRLHLGDDKITATVEMKARDKSFMVKEIDCAIVQTENINYTTMRAHPNVENAHQPGVPCNVNASRLVSALKRIENSDFDLDFGRKQPIDLDVRLDNFQLIPTERGLDWLEISHVVRFTVHFMDVNLSPVVRELPVFVDHPRISAEEMAALKLARSDSQLRLMNTLNIPGSEDSGNHSDRESTPEAA